MVLGHILDTQKRVLIDGELYESHHIVYIVP